MQRWKLFPKNRALPAQSFKRPGVTRLPPKSLPAQLALAAFGILALSFACNDVEDELALLNPFIGEDNLPRVIASTPFPGQENVADTTSVEILFNKPIDEQKCTQAFQLQPGVRGFFDVQSNRLQFFPASELDRGTYVFTLSKGCEDLEGRDLQETYTASFAVGGSATVGLRPVVTAIELFSGTVADCAAGNGVVTNILNTSISNACEGNPTQNPITLRFSKPMVQATTQAAFSLSPSVAGVYAWNGAGTALTFTPDAQLQTNQRYTVTISTGAEDIDGNTLDTPVQTSFVAGLLDNTPPTVTQVALEQTINSSGDACIAPANDVAVGLNSNTTDVCVNVPLIVTFSEAMDQASATAAISFSPFQDVTYNWAAANVLEITPLGAFESVTSYSFSVGTGAQDTAGNGLASPFGLTFTTEDARPRVLAIGLESQTNCPATPTGAAAGVIDWTSATCWWDNALAIRDPSNYQLRGGDDGTGAASTPAACADVNTDNIVVHFSTFMDTNSVIDAINLRRLSPPTSLIRLASWTWDPAFCQGVAPFGCSKVTLVFSEDIATCNGGTAFGDPTTNGDFNLAQSNFGLAGYPRYQLEIDSSARDVNNNTFNQSFTFTMEGK